MSDEIDHIKNAEAFLEWRRKRDREIARRKRAINLVVFFSGMIFAFGILTKFLGQNHDDIIALLMRPDNILLFLGSFGLLTAVYAFLEPPSLPAPPIPINPSYDSFDLKYEEELTDENESRIHFSQDIGSIAPGSDNLNIRNEHRTNVIFERMVLRLEAEIVALSKRGRVNLVLGIGITAIGLSVLLWAVASIPPGTDYRGHAMQFAPRLALAIVIEIFAYFFLRLYKEGLAGIRYFQNELTNLQSKQVALAAAQERIELEVRMEVIKNLTSTERNFILEKGQSTIDLEKSKFDHETTQLVLNQIGRIFRAQKGK